MSSVALGGEGWTYYETIGGGCGAGLGWNGESAIQCHMTNTLNTPAEALEMQYPLRVRRFERAILSGGDGKWVGGDGIIRELEALAPCSGTLLTTRRSSAPYGLASGGRGRPGKNQHLSQTSPTDLAGMAQFSLAPRDRLRIITPGGGGFGKGMLIDHYARDNAKFWETIVGYPPDNQAGFRTVGELVHQRKTIREHASYTDQEWKTLVLRYIDVASASYGHAFHFGLDGRIIRAAEATALVNADDRVGITIIEILRNRIIRLAIAIDEKLGDSQQK